MDTTRWQLDYSYADQIGLKVTIFPRQGSAVRPTVFNLDLRASDAAGKRRWLVSAFTPVREVSALPGSQPEASPSNSPRSERGSEAHLSAVWLLVPLGVLGLALLIPVGLGIAYWLRVRRAERDWARGRLG